MFLEPDEHTERGISDRLQALIDAWWNVHVLRERANQYRKTNREPKPPESFETVEQLANHNRAKGQYEGGLREVEGRAQGAESDFVLASEEVFSVLPPDTSVVYSYPYRSEAPSRVGQYRISHKSIGADPFETPSDDAVLGPQIVVEKLDA